jgi:hypothetical protein
MAARFADRSKDELSCLVVEKNSTENRKRSFTSE